RILSIQSVDSAIVVWKIRWGGRGDRRARVAGELVRALEGQVRRSQFDRERPIGLRSGLIEAGFAVHVDESRRDEEVTLGTRTIGLRALEQAPEHRHVAEKR